MNTTFKIGDYVRVKWFGGLTTRLATILDRTPCKLGGEYFLVEMRVVENARSVKQQWWVREHEVLLPLWKISPEIRGLSQSHR